MQGIQSPCSLLVNSWSYFPSTTKVWTKQTESNKALLRCLSLAWSIRHTVRDWEGWEGLSCRRESSGEILSIHKCLIMEGNKDDEVIPLLAVPRDRTRRNKHKLHFHLELWRTFFYFCDGDQTPDQTAMRKVLTLRPWGYSKHYWTWLCAICHRCPCSEQREWKSRSSELPSTLRYSVGVVKVFSLRCGSEMKSFYAHLANTLISTSSGADILNLSFL